MKTIDYYMSPSSPWTYLGNARFAAMAQRDKAKFEAFTQEALGRNVFGTPSYVYRDEIFWGQDRLDFLDRALSK